MTPTEKLKSFLTENYVSEDGDEYKVELKESLTDQQIDELAKGLPTGQIPPEIRELLKFASGFEFFGLEEVTFDGVGQFGFEEFFPNSVQLAGDGLGNFWILDIDKNGNWGSVFYVCHDPAVIVKHSDNLTQFIEHVNDFGKNGNKSNLDIIHEKVVMDIWSKDNGFIEIETAKQSNDTTLKNFALSLPDNFVVANPGEDWKVGCTSPMEIDNSKQKKSIDPKVGDTIITLSMKTKNVPTRQLIYFGLGNDIALMTYYTGGFGKSEHILIIKFDNNKIIDIWCGNILTDLTNKAEILKYLKENKDKDWALNTNIIYL